VPFTRQTLFFTATMPPEISASPTSSCTNPVRDRGCPAVVGHAHDHTAPRSHHGKDYEKRETLRRLIGEAQADRRAGRAQERHHLLQSQERGRDPLQACRNTASPSAHCMATWTSAAHERARPPSARTS
jgi:superfamily II DNA/RNA helicase